MASRVLKAFHAEYRKVWEGFWIVQCGGWFGLASLQKKRQGTTYYSRVDQKVRDRKARHKLNLGEFKG